MNHLINIGWKPFFQQEFDTLDFQGFQMARVVAEYQGRYDVYTEFGVIPAIITGKMRYQAFERSMYPAVGDWVVVEIIDQNTQAIIHDILPRISKFSRRAAGVDTAEQIVAANIDTLFLVTALNQDFNLRRIERYLLIAQNSGAQAVILLTKADLCEELDGKLVAVQAIAPHVPVHAVSSLTGEGIDELGVYLTTGQTVALLGSSGVGKSTLLNRLYGEDIQLVKTIREDDAKGRHTTTHRQLFQLPQGANIIDTPGMREIQLWDSGDSFGSTFDEVEELAQRCRFRDCLHQGEPDCAIQLAIEAGDLEHSRFRSYQKLQREQAFMTAQIDEKFARERQRKWKKVAKSYRQRAKQSLKG